MTARVANAPAGSPAAQPIDFVFDYAGGFVEYMHSQLFNGHLPAGKSWVKIDVGKLAKKQGVDLARLNQVDNGDPRKMFDMLGRAADPILIGQETVGDVTTSHYHATVDVRRLIASQTDPAVRRSLQRAMELSKTTSYPVDVWIDDGGYLRRMRMTVTAAEGDSRNAYLTMNITEDLSDFGAAAHVGLPAGATVADVTDLGN
jgi:hypothetical protein